MNIQNNWRGSNKSAVPGDFVIYKIIATESWIRWEDTFTIFKNQIQSKFFLQTKLLTATVLKGSQKNIFLKNCVKVTQSIIKVIKKKSHALVMTLLTCEFFHCFRFYHIGALSRNFLKFYFRGNNGFCLLVCR